MCSFSVTSANIAINDISLKTRLFGLHFHCRLYRSIFNHFDVIGPQSYQIRQKRKITVITPFKVTDFVTNRKPICDFLLVINIKLHPISHHFEVIADYWLNLHF